ncbi:MAG: hypothetical protein JSS87_06140 [Acidobacteria bacterium]|nr:hypothetical protein [Acidobacteriota bacterium]
MLAHPEKGRSHLSVDSQDHSRRWQLVSVVLCFAFSIAYILNIHPIGDGLWFWNAALVRTGKGLYTDIHFTLQPLFVVATAWNQTLLGTSWLASKVLALLQAVAYLSGIWLVAGFIPWKDSLKAWLIAGVFMLTTTCAYYRFDDYHITVQCLAVWSVYLLLRINDGREAARNLVLSALLGLLSGMALSDRLNDGAAIFAASTLAMLVMMRTRRISALLVFGAATVATLLGIVRLSDPSLHNWAYYSILHVAGIKGGTGNIITSTLLFPVFALWEFFKHWRTPVVVIAVAMMVLACVPFGLVDGRKSSVSVRFGSGLVFAVFGVWMIRLARVGVPGAALGLLMALLALVVAAWVLLGWLRPGVEAPSGHQVLILMPAALLFSGGMTSGHSVLECYPPAALFLLLFPISFPTLMRADWRRRACAILAGVLALSGTYYKIASPYSWHSYRDVWMFKDRVWYHHPEFGPMYIEKAQLNVIQPFCARIAQQGNAQGLLSVPYPYPNYFCNIPPWHGYVQTWYDTTSRETIEKLDKELSTAPPEWIVYQREIATLRSHEVAFNHGNPIPHRQLDALIESHLESGAWTLERQPCFDGSEWQLIHTVPANEADRKLPRPSNVKGISCPAGR